MAITSWRCPFCNCYATVQDANRTVDLHSFNHGNKAGWLGVVLSITVCPNSECREYAIQAKLFKLNGTGDPVGEPLQRWKLRPQSSGRPQPDYIPPAIVEDYEEACAIVDLSPKAAATLARRCIQGMIRDFHGIVKSRLIDEVNALKDRIAVPTWEAIDAIRRIGNIGAHMEKDINTIIDVEPEEAMLLIGLIESLFEDWYVARHEQESRLLKIKALAQEKAAMRQA
jgi:hypothetical protein